MSKSSVNCLIFFSPPLPETTTDGSFALENAQFRAVVDKYGRVTSAVIHGWDKETVCPRAGSANLICIYDDVPLFWDAWDVMDYHLETRKILNEVCREKID
jgi:alpha-mannosidase